MIEYLAQGYSSPSNRKDNLSSSVSLPEKASMKQSSTTKTSDSRFGMPTRLVSHVKSPGKLMGICDYKISFSLMPWNRNLRKNRKRSSFYWQETFSHCFLHRAT